MDYARFDSGVAVPGYVAREVGLSGTAYAAEDSMILNFAGRPEWRLIFS